MALTDQEQAFFDFAKGALPEWINTADEFLFGCAVMFSATQDVTIDLFSQTLIENANGPTSTTPDWLHQHARDRGTGRQLGEDDPTLRDRIRNVPDALIRSALLAAADAILAAAGIAGSSAMVELPRDAAVLGPYVADAATDGGTFTAGTGTQMIFTPTTPFARPPYRDPTIIRKIQSFGIDIVATNPDNSDDFTVLGVNGDGAVYDNAIGVPGADGGAEWSVNKRDRRGNLRDGYGRSYCSRGHRASSRRGAIVIMLPYGSTAGVEASVREMLRQKKAAGFRAIVERRTSPP